MDSAKDAPMQQEGGTAAMGANRASPAASLSRARQWDASWGPYLVLALIVGLHFAAALAMSDRPLDRYLTADWIAETVPFFILPVVVWIGWMAIVFGRRGVASPLRALKLVAFLNRRRVLCILLLIGLYTVTSRAYRAIKVALPRYADFYADPTFVQLDRAIFGTDPWRLTHALFGAGGTYWIDRLYILWLPVMLSMFAWTVFTSDRAFQLRSAFTHFLIWIVFGNLLALLLASAGPCFYEEFYGDPTFRPLMARLEGIGNLNALPLQAFLLNVRGDEALGAGISAMPSVHVAMTTLLVLMMHARFGWRWPTWLAVAYLGAILVGSVHLAWHYAVDGLLSLVLVPLLWFALGRILPRYPQAVAAT